MPLTFGDLTRMNTGNRWANKRRVTFDSSYPTGGETIAASDFGLHSIDKLDIDVLANSTPAARICDVNNAKTRLRVYTEAFAEVADATDLSAFSADIVATGL